MGLVETMQKLPSQGKLWTPANCNTGCQVFHHHLMVGLGQVMGKAVHYDIASVVNPAYSVVCRIGREQLADLRRY